MATDEEIIAAGKLLGKAYNIGSGYGESYADEQARAVNYVSHSWAKQARALADMGHPLVGAGGSPISGHSVNSVVIIFFSFTRT